METGIKSSFIPKDATMPRAPRQVGRTGFADLLILIAIVFLVASMALAAGVFLYLQYLQTSSASKLEQLERAKQAFEPALIQELTRLDDRMRAADQVLETHIAPSLFFDLLEQLTLQTVAFGNLNFQGGEAQNMTVVMDGVAQSVNSVALQADYLSKSGMITSPIFSNIDRRIDGVHFNLSAIINPLALRYANAVASDQQQLAAPQQNQLQPSPFEPQGAGATEPTEQIQPEEESEEQ